jgi:hypothetical protein
MNEGAPISRTKSLSKNTRDDLRPSDILIERFGAWKALVKQLIAYFEGVADVHSSTAKELTKLSAVIQVPFRAGNHFLGESGLQVCLDIINDGLALASQAIVLAWPWSMRQSQSITIRILRNKLTRTQDIYSDIRDKTRAVADEHANLGRTIDSSIVQHLQKVRTEIKAHIKVCFLPH